MNSPHPAPAPRAPAGWTGPDLTGSGNALRGQAAGQPQGPQSNGPRVAGLQTWLNANYPAYSRLAVDGWYGLQTAAVLREFAHRSGIGDADGLNIGPQLAAALTRAGLGLTGAAAPAGSAPAPGTGCCVTSAAAPADNPFTHTPRRARRHPSTRPPPGTRGPPLEDTPMRETDRYLTPGVVVTLLLVLGVVLLGTIGCVAWLTSIGRDPDPMLKLVGAWVAAGSSTVTLVLQLANRATVAKTERNTGVLANAVYEVADKMPQPVPRHAAADTVPGAGIRRGPGAARELRTGLEVPQPRGAPGAAVRHTVRETRPVCRARRAALSLG